VHRVRPDGAHSGSPLRSPAVAASASTREGIGSKKVAPSNLDRIDAKCMSKDIKRSFKHHCSFRTTWSSVGANGRQICDDGLSRDVCRSDPIRAAHHHSSLSGFYCADIRVCPSIRSDVILDREQPSIRSGMQFHVISDTTTLHRTEIRIAVLNETHRATKCASRRSDNNVLANAASGFPSESTTDVWHHDTNIRKFHLQRSRDLPLSRYGHLCRNQNFEATIR
jgi:hypothetical protein